MTRHLNIARSILIKNCINNTIPKLVRGIGQIADEVVNGKTTSAQPSKKFTTYSIKNRIYPIRTRNKEIQGNLYTKRQALD